MMSSRPSLLEQLKNIISAGIVLLLSLVFLPLGTFVFVWSSLTRTFQQEEVARAQRRSRSGFKPRVVLVSGIGTTSGLALARSLYQAGHCVIGADWEDRILTGNRFSKALTTFYSIPRSLEQAESAYYAQELLRIIGREDVDMWISCSSDPLQDAQARKVIECSSDRKCKCLSFDADTVKLLTAKNSFVDYLRSIDKPVPETHPVSSRASVHRILNASNGKGKKYVLRKTSGKQASPADLTQLPRRTLSQTYQHVSQVAVTTETPFILEEVIAGDEYLTQALVVRDKIQAFVATPIKPGDPTAPALPTDKSFSKALLRYTSYLVTRLERNVSGFIGLKLTVQKRPTEWGVELVLYATECTSHPTASGISIYSRGADLGERLIDALLPSQINGAKLPTKDEVPMIYPPPGVRFHDSAHDFFALIVQPVLAFLTLNSRLAPLTKSALSFLYRTLGCSDPAFEWWDPVPWWWACQIYWPLRIAGSVYSGQRWSSIEMEMSKIR